jgi:hypothetical protein
MSPLRVKNFGRQEFNDEKNTTKFYAGGGVDDGQEKIVMCSVINSGRPEGDDSL